MDGLLVGAYGASALILVVYVAMLRARLRREEELRAALERETEHSSEDRGNA